jgi:quinoprotein glucose dehydrogenase
MLYQQTTKKILPFCLITLLLILSCVKTGQKGGISIIKEDPGKALKNAKSIRDKTPIKVADGLQVTLWASDTLSPDPVAMSIDNLGRVYITRTNRQKNSEFDIRGHRDWMTESISLQTVEDRRAFLRKTFAPELSAKNEWLKDLNFDGNHDWRDLTVEKEEVWRLEDTNKDGVADVATKVLDDFHDEVSDIAAGLLVRENDAFLTLAPDVWHLENPNKQGVWQKKTSISTGYAVHIGFGGHNLSGIIEGPDGRLYWNQGDIGGNITTKDGKNWANPNSGFIARSNPDGSDFEIFATGLRNTHEFVFDDYGNLISSDNDGDHPGESERLVHIVEGSDAGWRSNWQYGKYTDPKNNSYKVWMAEKLYVPRWDGQAAYIIPPIQNFHNGPTGMQYNPGTALGSAWKNKFFLVEFVGTPTRSPIWAFGLKPKGASFVLDGEQNIVSGILPTGIHFGPDGALYAADWLNGWDTKNYGRVWKIDVTPDKNDLAAIRQETERLMKLNYSKQNLDYLYDLLSFGDKRIRQKAQFELAKRGQKGFETLQKAALSSDNQLARIHGIWGMGQFARQDKQYATSLTSLLKDKDEEIIVQAIKMLGDADITSVGDALIPFLQNPNHRLRFYAAEALGQLKHVAAVEPLINMLKTNNDEDHYIRHAGALALSRIGKVEPITALANNPSKALRTAAVLVLRHLKNEQIALFLNDKDEYIATEAARGINDDLSIPSALPALAATLKEKRFTSEALLRRAINAALRVGGEKELDILIDFSKRNDISDAIKAEALATLGTWANPSVLDRVDGRFRGKIQRDPALVKRKIQSLIPTYLKETNPETLVAVAGLLANLDIPEANADLAKIYAETKEIKVKNAILPALSQLKYAQLSSLIKTGMEDKEESVRTTALGLLNNDNVSKENLQAIVQSIFTKGGVKEQQQLLVVMSKLDKDKTVSILEGLVAQMKDKKLSPNLNLELQEAVDATGSESLKSVLASMKNDATPMSDYASALFGGNRNEGRIIFQYNSTAQCTRCHAVNGEGGNVGPDLTNIGNTLTREQLLQAMIEPTARLAPGYGSVTLKLKEGQEVTGILVKETEEALTLKTSDAEPLVVPISRISKRENMTSSMTPYAGVLSKREVRDIVEYLSGLKKR